MKEDNTDVSSQICAQHISVSEGLHDTCTSKHCTPRSLLLCWSWSQHCTVPKWQENATSHKKKVTTGKGRKLERSQRLFSPLLVSILVSRSILGTNSRVCLLFTVLVLDFRREIRKPVHCIKWKTLIWLSVSETALGSRRKNLLHCQMPQENPLPKPSKKILC